jgi:hypothetical protein
MASERQIAANRLNARKSTGPLSRAGKRRASRNAYRHGLASRRKPDAATSRKLDQLARQIVGDSDSEIILELARSAAEAEFDLARVRLARVALINRVSAFGAIDPFFDKLAKDKARWRRLRLQSSVQDFIDSTENMPTQQSERAAEAVRRALPELVKLDRYQVRATSRRNRAIEEIINIKSN